MVGAPPKSHEYDRQLVTDILACREKLNIVCPAAEEEAESIALTVNSGNAHLLDFTAEGILEKSAELWFMRTGLADTRKDIFVNEKLVNRYGLREGDVLCGRCVREESRRYTETVLHQTVFFAGGGTFDADSARYLTQLVYGFRTEPTGKLIQ